MQRILCDNMCSQMYHPMITIASTARPQFQSSRMRVVTRALPPRPTEADPNNPLDQVSTILIPLLAYSNIGRHMSQEIVFYQLSFTHSDTDSCVLSEMRPVTRHVLEFVRELPRCCTHACRQLRSLRTKSPNQSRSTRR